MQLTVLPIVAYNLQEVMLACALYARDESFLSLVHSEVQYQVSQQTEQYSIIIFFYVHRLSDWAHIPV
jgi:hypothetical protein